MANHRLNILIGRSSMPGQIGPTGTIGFQPQSWIYVAVRDGSWMLDRDDPIAAGRPVGVSVEITRERWNPTARNNGGGIGAFVDDPDLGAVERHLDELLAAWGPLHVQDNTGKLPHRHQGMFAG